MTSNTKPYFHATGFITLLENRYARMWAVYNPTESYYIHNGEKIPSDVFEAMYPLELGSKRVSKGDNPNGRTNWMD